ncbi:hypothetical protein JXM83_01950 [Candidatus Woesearchaeota archaeon]|nr:hypothetical protein [Candidatus Woesearchaeota archaeon]
MEIKTKIGTTGLSGSIDSVTQALHARYEHVSKTGIRRYDRFYQPIQPALETKQLPSYDNRPRIYRR